MKICILSWLKKILTKKHSQESLEMKGDNYSMKYEKIEKDDEFFNWFGYAPTDAQYVRYSQEKPSVIAAVHKIEDVYYGFANARHSFMCAGLDNLGDVCGNDELSRTYAKSHFLTCALLEYALCLDLSWQVVWAYVQPSSFDYLVKKDYKAMEKECTRESLIAQLNCIIAQNSYGLAEAQKLVEILTNFDNDQNVINLRAIYNKCKHQGTIHFKGLGNPSSELMISVGKNSIPILCRDEYCLEEIEELLFYYHDAFKNYFDSIINLIMPKDYKETKVDLLAYAETALKMNDSLNKSHDKK